MKAPQTLTKNAVNYTRQGGCCNAEVQDKPSLESSHPHFNRIGSQMSKKNAGAKLETNFKDGNFRPCELSSAPHLTSPLVNGYGLEDLRFRSRFRRHFCMLNDIFRVHFALHSRRAWEREVRIWLHNPFHSNTDRKLVRRSAL